MRRSISGTERSLADAHDGNRAVSLPSYSPVIVSIHIPKCGGISFQHVLRGIYGKKRLWLNYGAFINREQARYDLIPPGTRCIHGHFLADTFDELVPQPELVTWLRHPVQRVVSNYYHFLRHPDPGNPCCRELLEKRLSLEKFAELDFMRNEATRYLAGKPLSAFKFVGIMEKFEESLAVFGTTFGVSVPTEPPRENRNPGRFTDTYPLCPRTYDHILSLNLRDLMVYGQVLAQLWSERQRARATGPR